MDINCVTPKNSLSAALVREGRSSWAHVRRFPRVAGSRYLKLVDSSQCMPLPSFLGKARNGKAIAFDPKIVSDWPFDFKNSIVCRSSASRIYFKAHTSEISRAEWYMQLPTYKAPGEFVLAGWPESQRPEIIGILLLDWPFSRSSPSLSSPPCAVAWAQDVSAR